MVPAIVERRDGSSEFSELARPVRCSLGATWCRRKGVEEKRRKGVKKIGADIVTE
jgi:hypothetical protein